MADLHERLLARIAEDSDGCEDTSAQALVDALRAVVELHAPRHLFDGAQGWQGDFPVCHGCDIDGQGAERPSWPCSTIKTIAAQLGVEIGEIP